MELDLDLVDNLVFEDVDYSDYPDFCNAFVASADYDGHEMTEEELDVLNSEYHEWTYEQLLDQIF